MDIKIDSKEFYDKVHEISKVRSSEALTLDEVFDRQWGQALEQRGATRSQLTLLKNLVKAKFDAGYRGECVCGNPFCLKSRAGEMPPTPPEWAMAAVSPPAASELTYEQKENICEHIYAASMDLIRQVAQSEGVRLPNGTIQIELLSPQLWQPLERMMNAAWTELYPDASFSQDDVIPVQQGIAALLLERNNIVLNYGQFQQESQAPSLVRDCTFR